MKTPKKRELIRYQPDESTTSAKTSQSLNDLKHEQFDQFANKKSTYDFNNYTSNFDHRKLTDKQKKEAKRIEKEIIADEKSRKNEALEVEDDEETKFSSVKRDDFKDKLIQNLAASPFKQ